MAIAMMTAYLAVMIAAIVDAEDVCKSGDQGTSASKDSADMLLQAKEIRRHEHNVAGISNAGNASGAGMWTFTVSMVMTPECAGMAYASAENATVPMGGDKPTVFYHENEVLTRPIGVCTTNVLGSSVIFTCEGDRIDEHVYVDAATGPYPLQPDCSGEVKYIMPIANGCNSYTWGSMSAVWSGYCMG